MSLDTVLLCHMQFLNLPYSFAMSTGKLALALGEVVGVSGTSRPSSSPSKLNERYSGALHCCHATCGLLQNLVTGTRHDPIRNIAFTWSCKDVSSEQSISLASAVVTPSPSDGDSLPPGFAYVQQDIPTYSKYQYTLAMACIQCCHTVCLLLSLV